MLAADIEMASGEAQMRCYGKRMGDLKHSLLQMVMGLIQSQALSRASSSSSLMRPATRVSSLLTRHGQCQTRCSYA